MQQKRNTNLSWEFLRAKELNDDQSETNKQTKITMKTIDSTFGCNKSPVQIKSNLLDCDESRERKEKKKRTTKKWEGNKNQTIRFKLVTSK